MTTYRNLPLLDGLGMPHAWNEYGPGDEFGSINRLTPDRVLAALGLPRTGRVINLSLPLNLPSPPMFGRKPYRHTIFPLSRNEQDDYLDGFYLQASSQWDGLRHVQAREFGFYGGRSPEEVGAEGHALGIQAWTEHGIVGRGLLLDVAAQLATDGTPLDPRSNAAITVETLERTAAVQGVSIRPGDILLVRTGWLAAYLGLDDAERAAVASAERWPGLEGSEEMAEFLWDHEIAALVADNPAVELSPGNPAVGSLHRRLIPLLGMALGELWNLEELAAFGHQNGIWECCLVAVPLNLPNGVGSPANAIAIV